MASPTEVLQLALEYTKENWCAYKNGRATKRVGKGDCCLMQNIMKAEIKLHGHTGSRKNGRDNATAAEDCVYRVLDGRPISLFNDTHEHAEVLGLLEKAIEKSKEPPPPPEPEQEADPDVGPMGPGGPFRGLFGGPR